MFCYIVNDLLKIFKWTYSLENRCDKESEEKWKKHVLQIVWEMFTKTPGLSFSSQVITNLPEY